MSTSVWVRLSNDPDPDVRLGVEVGYRVGIGGDQTAFQWLARPGEMERWTEFEDEFGRVYSRSELTDFILACDELHERGCACSPVRHPAGMWGPAPSPETPEEAAE